MGLFDRLRAGPLSGLRLGLMHGRLTGDEKDAVMAAFRAGEVDVLVCTTVIEVGVDVPNATVMLVLTPTGSASASCTSCAAGSAAASIPACACW